MERLDKHFLMDRLETLELDEARFPERLDVIFSAEKGSEFRVEDYEVPEHVSSWLENAEKWDETPRRSAFIPNYFELDERVESELVAGMESELESPGLEGVKLAANAIQAQKEKPAVNFSAYLGLPVNRLEEEFNMTQVAGPYGADNMVETPVWLGVDDWYSDIGEENYVGVIIDDDTAYARHIMDNGLIMENEDREFDPRFWQSYQETIQGYTGWI
ncbi:hypothetical protein [Candidatus Nanohalococcus occultus]|uniref:Uncharacterized protein n=1 Tax=Candidatus Nanohalococcus occultus TaxID=2978047 RepID=A0ABY8CJ05_9ARCH|nr:hypothetical protein SVXNc_0642 [Candidatus Nanohaloarchaeota archaeon SVXNc]